MAKETTKVSKSETLTIRLDPKTRFVLEYLSRLKGQTITTVVERAILSAASDSPTRTGPNENDFVTWQELWDVSEGARALKLARQQALFPSYEEERRLEFAREHWPFFFTDKWKVRPQNFYVDVLWPRIDEFLQIHDAKKHENYFAAGEAMAVALAKARLEAPEWPIKNNGEETRQLSRDIDSDIPF